jgi:hypothetical protein
MWTGAGSRADARSLYRLNYDPRYRATGGSRYATAASRAINPIEEDVHDPVRSSSNSWQLAGVRDMVSGQQGGLQPA